MTYAKINEFFTTLGCRVVRIRTVARKDFVDIEGEPQGSLLTPVEHVFLSCPDEEKDDEKGLTNAT